MDGWMDSISNQIEMRLGHRPFCLPLSRGVLAKETVCSSLSRLSPPRTDQTLEVHDVHENELEVTKIVRYW